MAEKIFIYTEDYYDFHFFFHHRQFWYLILPFSGPDIIA